jgi:glycosyltransferase involved in cell wall biosynthesis
MMDGGSARRIALVGPAAPWRGGIAHYVDSLSAALAGRGHETRILSFRRQYPRLLFPGRNQRESGARPRPETALALDTLNPFTWFAGGRALRAWSPDAVVFNYWLPFFVPAYAGVAGRLRRPGTRILFDCHNVLPHERRLLDGLLTRWMLGLPDRFIVHSIAVRDVLLSRHPDADWTLAPLPISADFPEGPGRAEARRRLGVPAAARVLLVFGFIRHYKGLDTAVRALAELPADVHLLVGGEFYEPKAPYVAAIEELGLEDRVHIVDRYVPREEVGEFFDASDLVLLSYHRATQSGILPLAWRYGLPAVASRVGGLLEQIRDGENGLLVPPGDARALASAVMRGLDGTLGARLREGVARARAALSWDRLALAIESCVG